VDQGRRAIGRTIEVTVTSVLQTTAGKMIFCRWPEATLSAEGEPRRDGRPAERQDRREARGGRDFRGDGRRDVGREPGYRPAAEQARPEGETGSLQGSGNGPTGRE
jgi:hypothetical protein